MHDPMDFGIEDIPIIGPVVDGLLGTLDGALDGVADSLTGHDPIDRHHPVPPADATGLRPPVGGSALDAGTSSVLEFANELSIQNAKLGDIVDTVMEGDELSSDQLAELDRVSRAAASWGPAFEALDASQQISHDVSSSIDRREALDAAQRETTDAWIEGERAERLIADTNSMLPAGKRV
jgi:hypothetical protein